MSQDDWRSRLEDERRRFDNRRIYTSFNIETLRAIPDDELEQAIFDYAIGVLWDDNKPRFDNFRSLPIGIQALYTTWMVDAEVNNGGFNQYFWNLSGAFAEDAVAGFSFFGAPALAAVLRHAIEVAGGEADRRNEFKREQTLEAFSESYKHTKLGELDKQYYNLAADLSATRIKVIRAHPEQFITGPQSVQ